MYYVRRCHWSTINITPHIHKCAHAPALFQGSEGASAALQEQIREAEDKIDKKLLRMFQSAVKAEKVVRALEVASQLRAVRSLEGALKLANHHRYSCHSFARLPALGVLR